MVRLCTISLSGILMTIVYCNADPLRRQVADSSLCFNYQCPSTDNAFYPLALDISGPAIIGNPTTYLECYYPYVPNCQYGLRNGSLLHDYDSGYCPGQATCTGSTCKCPRSDNANYALGTPPKNNIILFCPYPIPSQPEIAEYHCNYDSMTGAFIHATDPTDASDPSMSFCPAIAIPANQTFCFHQSAVIDGATVPPTAGNPSATTTPATYGSGNGGPPSPSPTAFRGSSPGFHGDDLRLRIIWTAIVGVTLWQVWALV